MKKLSTIVVLLFSIALFGQSDTIKSKKLLIGLTASPDICYRTLKNNDGSATSSMVIDSRNSYEIPKLGYSTGFSICYSVSNHVGFETGLQYSNKGEKFVNSNLTFGDAIDPRRGFTYTNGSAPTKIKLIYNYNYIDVPLRTIFTFGNRKTQFISSIGVTTNIFINYTQKSIIIFENGDKERNTQNQQYTFNPINFSPTVSLGVDYRFTEKINLRIEPTFRYGLIKIIDTPVTSYLWSGGLSFSCYYRIQ
ncbi:MAG: outer membrane beta-barrel protein [Bacteroidia bacterium]